MRENLANGPWIGTLASLHFPTTLYRLKQLLGRCHRATSSTPKQAARLYRRQLVLIGLKDKAVEVLCYIKGSQHASCPLLHIYLPADFDQFYEAVYHKDPANARWRASNATHAASAFA